MSEGSITFKKRTKPSTRSKRDIESDADATTEVPSEVGGGESPISLVTKLKKRVKPKSRLSFGAEEEEGDGEVFQLKKSNLSRKLELSKQSSLTSGVLTSPFNPIAGTPPSTGPSYSAAYLNELKASTPSSRPRVADDESISYDADVSMGTSMYSTQVVDLTEDAEGDTVIPSGASITAAKEKRERLRKTVASGSEDYISLSLTKKENYSTGPHPSSRLVREEDELGEGDDEFAEYTSAQERIALGKKSRKVEAQKRRENMNELIADAEEEDEETMEWEQEQLRRGGLRTESPAVSAQKPVYKPAPIPTPTQIPTLGAAVASLSRALATLTTSHTQHTSSMVSMGDERTRLDLREKELRSIIVTAEDKRSWFAAFREWIESVATFLDEKYPLLEKLEDEHVSLLKERSEMIAKRRLAEDEDDLSLFLGGLPTPPREQLEETDELGRVIPQSNPTIVRRERLAARNLRRQHRLASKSARQNQEDEGFSTDSSLPPSDAADFVTATQKVKSKSRDVLADVKAKDFLDPRAGLVKWFGEWRDRFGETYTGAWGGLGMVGAWEFWTRLEILGWDPLEDTRTLDTFNWYAALHDYSRPRQQMDEDEDMEPELGPDGDLVFAMITTAVIPRVCKLLEGGSFDPYSGKHIRRLVDLVEEIEISTTKENAKFEMLLKSVFLVFQSAIKATEAVLPNYLALNRPHFDPEAIPARRRFLVRQYKLLHNIVRWRRYASDKFGLGLLVSALVSDCIFPVAEGGWEVGGEEVMQKVVGVLPPELVPVPVKVRMSLK
ncbi:nineteen complex-related protein 2-domain-containing protein [Cristinia sonorae]|uniref:Nineteen complex-related protein 2-domain-containing protein n=1 Tax=Cristinia sonorae TaxID=1940300 RepID=A0A8K0XL19_9AGAR|nr:nineteen complex-related protein 2-domain-containing protein [Cristinia sonorae]